MTIKHLSLMSSSTVTWNAAAKLELSPFFTVCFFICLQYLAKWPFLLQLKHLGPSNFTEWVLFPVFLALIQKEVDLDVLITCMSWDFIESALILMPEISNPINIGLYSSGSPTNIKVSSHTSLTSKPMLCSVHYFTYIILGTVA